MVNLGLNRSNELFRTLDRYISTLEKSSALFLQFPYRIALALGRNLLRFGQDAFEEIVKHRLTKAQLELSAECFAQVSEVR